MRKLALSALGLAMALVAGAATAAVFGDWGTGTTDDGNLYAAVMNDSQSILIKVCSPGTTTCIWYLGTQTRCDPGAKSPALVSSSLGAATLDLVCDKPIQLRNTAGVHYRYAVINYDLMDRIATSANGTFGIAMALESGKFAVYRFSSNGGKQAVSTLEEAALRLYRRNNPSAPASGNRDSVL